MAFDKHLNLVLRDAEERYTVLLRVLKTKMGEPADGLEFLQSEQHSRGMPGPTGLVRRGPARGLLCSSPRCAVLAEPRCACCQPWRSHLGAAAALA